VTAPDPTDGSTVDGKPTFMVVTLKSGQQIRMKVSEYTVAHNGLGELARLNWTCAEDTAAMIRHLDLGEVAAVHTEWP
jgi:hypothetical protein